MWEYIKRNPIVIFISSFVWGITIFIVTRKPITEEKVKVVEKIIPKTDSIIAAADSIVTILEIQKKEKIKLKKEKELVEKELVIEKKKKEKSPKEKTKIVFETKEVIVEKEVKVQDPNARQAIIESYKIQDENCRLKEELRELKRMKEVEIPKKMPKKDTITTDTIKRKRIFGIF
jgi:hypothetical protein